MHCTTRHVLQSQNDLVRVMTLSVLGAECSKNPQAGCLNLKDILGNIISHGVQFFMEASCLS